MAQNTSGPKPPDLSLIENIRESDADSERRKRPRLTLAEEQFRLSQNGKIFSVADLSIEGMALRIIDPEDLAAFPVAARVDGTLNLRGEKHAIGARVSRVSEEIVGFIFEELSAETRVTLQRFLDPEVLGRELRPIPSTGAASHQDGPTLWYHGPSGTDLLFWRRLDGNYRRMTLYVLGMFIQWDEEKGLTTGTARASAHHDSEEWGIVRFETLLTREDSTVEPTKLKIAKELILSSNLPEDLKGRCERWLTRPEMTSH